MAAERSRRRIPILVALVLLVAGGAAWGWWAYGRPAAATTPTLSGVVESKQYQVGSVIGGRVTQVSASEGDHVAAGQVVVQLDPAPLQLGVDQANAGLQAAQAAAQQARDDDLSTAEIAAADAKVTQADAAVNLAKVQLGYAAITAPHAGTVVTVTTNAGQNASPGKTLMTIIDTDDVYVRVFVPENQLDQATIGRAARITTDGGGRFDATITYVSSTSEFTPNNVETKDQRAKLLYEVRVSVSGAAGKLKPGQPADVAFA